MHARRFRRWFERYKILAALRGFLQWIGVWGILMSLFFSVFAFLWARFEHLAPPVRFVVALAALVLVAGVVAVMSYLWSRKSAPPATEDGGKVLDAHGGEYSAPAPKIAPTFGSLITSALVIVVLIAVGRYTGAVNRLAGMLKPLQDTAIFMQCDPISLPLTIHPREHIEVVGINEKMMRRQSWGWSEIPNESSKDILWPGKELMEESNRLKNPGVVGYKCTVSNRGPSAVLYLGVPIDFWFNNQETAFRYSPIVSGLRPTDTFTFYVFNDCNTYVSGAWQEVANARILGESELRQIPLRRRYRNPAEQVMMFFPSTVNWTRQLPCE
jgi:hypothetical protein